MGVSWSAVTLERNVLNLFCYHMSTTSTNFWTKLSMRSKSETDVKFLSVAECNKVNIKYTKKFTYVAFTRGGKT